MTATGAALRVSCNLSARKIRRSWPPIINTGELLVMSPTPMHCLQSIESRQRNVEKKYPQSHASLATMSSILTLFRSINLRNFLRIYSFLNGKVFSLCDRFEEDRGLVLRGGKRLGCYEDRPRSRLLGGFVRTGWAENSPGACVTMCSRNVKTEITLMMTMLYKHFLGPGSPSPGWSTAPSATVDTTSRTYRGSE